MIDLIVSTSFQRKIQPIVPFDQTAPNLFYNYLYSISRGIAQYWSFRKLISIFLIIFISIFYSPLCRCFTYCLTYPVKRKTRQNKTQDCDHRSVYPDSFIILAAFDLTSPATPDKNFFFEKKIIILTNYLYYFNDLYRLKNLKREQISWDLN